MKKFTSILLLCLLSLSFSTPTYAILAPAAEAGTVDARQERLQRRMQQFKARLEYKLFKKHKKSAPPQLWEDGRFRMGIIALAVALGLALIAGLGILSGFFGLLAGLAAVAGLVLVVWALVENA